MTDPGARRKPGEGPKAVFLSAGRGRVPLQHNGAGDWWVHETLGSVHRLQIITWLCTHPGSHTAPQIAAALGVKYQAIQPHLIAMQYAMLADAVWTPGYHAPAGNWIPDHRRWTVSDAGRRYLWRFGWVTGRLVPGVWQDDTWFGDAHADPVQILGQFASDTLTRPMQLALASLLWQCGPLSPTVLQNALGIRRQILRTTLNLWEAARWAEPTLIAPPKHGKPLTGTRRAAKWRFTRNGLMLMEHHCHAVRWAAQHAGYSPPPDDRWFCDKDGIGWNAVSWDENDI